MARAEIETWGYDHSEVGEAIIDSWGLPNELVVTIGYHHNPIESRIEYSRIASTLYIADYICQERGFAFGAVPESNNKIFQQCLDLIDVKPYAVDIIFKEMNSEIAKMEDKGLVLK
jgi:HD superfamily phosphohydrolase YqeK